MIFFSRLWGEMEKELTVSGCLCATCAAIQQTCCQRRDIFVTMGDIRRIAAYTGRPDFFQRRASGDPAYLDQEDDPLWAEHVVGKSGERRLLRQRGADDCIFLERRGCFLPLAIRPLVCRLFPYEYDANGIFQAAARDCPVHLLPAGRSVFESLGMNRDTAATWHRMLYLEILEKEGDTC